MFVFESTRIKNGGPPLHYHYTQDEWFYILKGDFLFKIGDVNLLKKQEALHLTHGWYRTLLQKQMMVLQKC